MHVGRGADLFSMDEGPVGRMQADSPWQCLPPVQGPLLARPPNITDEMPGLAIRASV